MFFMFFDTNGSPNTSMDSSRVLDRIRYSEIYCSLASRPTVSANVNGKHLLLLEFNGRISLIL